MFADDIDDFHYLRDEILNSNIDPWDKSILFYLGYIGYQNFQLANKSYQHIQTISVDNPFQFQFMIYFLLFYSLNNIYISYRYFLLKTYTINPELARRIYNKFNKYFDFFSTPTSKQYEIDSSSDEDEEITQEEINEIIRYTRYPLNENENE